MRVALIGPVPPALGGLTPGGVATHQAQLAYGLASAGISASLLATNTAVSAACWRAPRRDLPYAMYRMIATRRHSVRQLLLGSASALHVLRYLPRVASTRTYGSRAEVLRNALAYRRFFDEVRPQVIHVQHPLERCTYARLVRRFEGWRVPLVVTAHSLFGEHADATIHNLMAPNLRVADRVIAVNDHIADQAIQLGVQPSRVRVIRSGVDTQRFQPRDRAAARQRLAIADHARVVLFVGNLEPRKQVDVLLRAVAHARAQVPTLRLLIVGSGESAGVEDQTPRLLRLSQELELDAAVQFTGRLGDSQLLDAYAAADVFALSSSSEAQGIVVLEAMASGLPVVATAVGGLLGTIENGRTGVLVESGDANGLGQRLAELLTDPSRRAEIGSAAREEVEMHFAWSRAVADTIEVYREVVS